MRSLKNEKSTSSPVTVFSGSLAAKPSRTAYGTTCSSRATIEAWLERGSTACDLISHPFGVVNN